TTLLPIVLFCIHVIFLLRPTAARPRPFLVPMVPLFPILGVILFATLMLSLPLETWGRFFVWLAIGLLIYFLYSVRHSKLRRGIDVGETENIFPPIAP